MIFGSVCSGIEAATQAWAPLGWEPAFYSEIERFPRAVLEHHHPDVPLHGDFTTIGADDYGPIDLLCGGTPCQSFSVAGLRGGMDDERGNLSLGFVKLAKRKRPRWVVWENVVGVLSSNGGRDFGSIVGALVKLGYGVCWRVLDAQYVRVDGFARAVPQRRRRVVLVGYLGDWRRAAAVLFERESLFGHTPPSRKAGEKAAPTLSARPSGGGGLGTDFEVDGGLIPDVAGCLQERDAKGADSDTKPGHLIPIAIQERAVCENPHAGPDGAAYTLEARTTPQAVAFQQNSRSEVRLMNGDGQIAGAVTSEPGVQQQNYVQTVAFQDRFRGDDGRGYDRGPAVSIERTGSLETVKNWNIALLSAVRRLTPVECERLMGFPDNFTRIPYRGKPAEQCPDGPRYKALGNSWPVNVFRWVGQRIALVDRLEVVA